MCNHKEDLTAIKVSLATMSADISHIKEHMKDAVKTDIDLYNKISEVDDKHTARTLGAIGAALLAMAGALGTLIIRVKGSS